MLYYTWRDVVRANSREKGSVSLEVQMLSDHIVLAMARSADAGLLEILFISKSFLSLCKLVSYWNYIPSIQTFTRSFDILCQPFYPDEHTNDENNASSASY